MVRHEMYLPKQDFGIFVKLKIYLLVRLLNHVFFYFHTTIELRISRHFDCQMVCLDMVVPRTRKSAQRKKVTLSISLSFAIYDTMLSFIWYTLWIVKFFNSHLCDLNETLIFGYIRNCILEWPSWTWPWMNSIFNQLNITLEALA